MYEAYNRLVLFTENIGDIKYQPIRSDALAHCGRSKQKLGTQYDEFEVLKLGKNRIEK